MSEQMRREWFFEQRDGNCRLMAPFAATLSETAMMWREEVGAFAESIAESLWGARLMPIRSKTPATRLTQRQKSRSRARLLNGNEDVAPLSPAMCKMCNYIRMLNDSICDECASAR